MSLGLLRLWALDQVQETPRHRVNAPEPVEKLVEELPKVRLLRMQPTRRASRMAYANQRSPKGPLMVRVVGA